jgi:hypothetical protein
MSNAGTNPNGVTTRVAVVKGRRRVVTPGGGKISRSNGLPSAQLDFCTHTTISQFENFVENKGGTNRT